MRDKKNSKIQIKFSPYRVQAFFYFLVISLFLLMLAGGHTSRVL